MKELIAIYEAEIRLHEQSIKELKTKISDLVEQENYATSIQDESAFAEEEI